MKSLVLISAFSLTTLVCAAQEAVPTVPVPAMDKQIDLPAGYHTMWPDQFFQYLRAYDLSNGQTLVLYNRGSTVYASLDHGQPHKLVTTAGNTFVALDRSLKMHIDLGEGEQASGYVLIAVPEQRMADGSVQPAQVLRLAFG